MPQIDAYPAARALTGAELLPGVQDGDTKAISIEMLAARLATLLQPLVVQAVASTVATPASPATPSPNDATGLVIGILGLNL